MVALVVFLCPVAAAARDGGHPGRWWQMPKVSEKLGLSQEEKDTLDALYVKNRRALLELKSDVEKERFELDNVLYQRNLNDRKAIEQFKRLEQKREKLAMERFLYLLEVRKILGHERYQTLMETFKEFRSKRARGQDHDFPGNE